MRRYQVDLGLALYIETAPNPLTAILQVLNRLNAAGATHRYAHTTFKVKEI